MRDVLKRVGHVIGLYLAPLMRGRDNESELLELDQAVDQRWRGKARLRPQEGETQGNTLIGYAAAGVDHDEVDLDRLSLNAGQKATVEEDTFEPFGLNRRCNRHWNPLPQTWRRLLSTVVREPRAKKWVVSI